jgi:hypothetical protein
VHLIADDCAATREIGELSGSGGYKLMVGTSFVPDVDGVALRSH